VALLLLLGALHRAEVEGRVDVHDNRVTWSGSRTSYAMLAAAGRDASYAEGFARCNAGRCFMLCVAQAICWRCWWCLIAASWINTDSDAVARTFFKVEVLLDSSLCMQTPAVMQYRLSGKLESGMQLRCGLAKH
jgi:hypothetical protein